MEQKELTGLFHHILIAYRNWFLENNQTPYLKIKTAGCLLPQNLMHNDTNVLNISDQAISGLFIGEKEIGFSTRFNGQNHQVMVPMKNVLEFYSYEQPSMKIIAVHESDQTDEEFQKSVAESLPKPQSKLRLLD